MPFRNVIPRSEVYVHTPGATTAGQGTTNTKIRRYTVEKVNTGTAITYADNVANGASFTINETGYYAISRSDGSSASAWGGGVSVNSNQLTTNFVSITESHKTAIQPLSSAANFTDASADTVFLTAGDVVRAHDGSVSANLTSNGCWLKIMKVSHG